MFHRLAKHGIVHQFIKVPFKVRRRLSSLVCVEVDIGFDPRILGKFQNAINACQSHSQPNVKFQVDIVGHVFCFVVQIRYEFFRIIRVGL